jgi:hypothetical protein
VQELVKTINLVGYYQTISLDFGAFSVSPFVNLNSVSNTLSMQLLTTNWIMILVELNSQITAFIGQNALGLIFPVGLVLRTFFATRKVGGFLIALAVGLYVFYPTFILIFPNPGTTIINSTIKSSDFTSNSYYATAPVIDLNDNYAIAGKLDVLSGRCNPNNYSITNMTNVSNTTTACDDYLQTYYLQMYNLTSNASNTTQNQSADLSGDLTAIIQSNSSALAKSILYSVIAPIFSLIVTIVFVKELANILGSDIGLRTIASI